MTKGRERSIVKGKERQISHIEIAAYRDYVQAIRIHTKEGNIIFLDPNQLAYIFSQLEVHTKARFGKQRYPRATSFKAGNKILKTPTIEMLKEGA